MIDNKLNSNISNQISKNEIRKIQLEILTSVDIFCRKYDIKYSLYYGSLLGAIRHNGFIPWDDDIDIAMTRENYNFFLEKFNKFNPKYEVIGPNENESFPFWFSKICDNDTLQMERIENKPYYFGISIDLFPLDYAPNMFRAFFKKIYFSYWKFLMLSKTVDLSLKRNFMKMVIIKLSFLFSKRKTAGLLCYKANKKISNKNKSKRIWCPLSTYGHRDAFNISVMQTYTYHIFEGEKFLILKEYDKILKKIYGNYMVLPTEEKRISHHNFVCYYKKDMKNE